MHSTSKKVMEEYYPRCRSLLEIGAWDRIIGLHPDESGPETLPETLMVHRADLDLPEFLPELARLEWNFHQIASNEIKIQPGIEQIKVNPTLQLFQVCWKGLPGIFKSPRNSPSAFPMSGEEFVLIWKDSKTGQTEMETASNEELLALKMVVEGIEPQEVATAAGLPIGAVDAAINRAADRGILLQPGTRIRRDPANFPMGKITDDLFLSSSLFTLQWHITQACDLHCKHCYDRSERSPLTLEKGLAILDDLRSFCRSRQVKGQVSFSGGNPLLYPHFTELYRAATERGFGTAVLGNPAPRGRIEELLEIQRPNFFQVSLEGLPDHNDAIRGPGHFERVMEFLGVLRELRIYSMVMLTLTRDNLDQVLPLAEVLRRRTDSFTFNRLSQVGEGAKLQPPSPGAYSAFLEAYLKAEETNPILALKDNLINILYHRQGSGSFGGCTGFGCGAAFNFLTVLPDGEVHACRKFPSLIGNVFGQSLGEIYESEAAQRYRAGTTACRPCPIRPVCGGCLAVVYGHGLDVLKDRDPYCFIEKQ